MPRSSRSMNEKEVALWSDGGLNVTLTIRLLMHGKVRLANSCIGNVCVTANSAEITVDPIAVIHYESQCFTEMYLTAIYLSTMLT